LKLEFEHGERDLREDEEVRQQDEGQVAHLPEVRGEVSWVGYNFSLDPLAYHEFGVNPPFGA